jgi:hypothetical protein
MRWQDGRVSTEDSVAMPNAVTGRALRDAYWEDIQKLTLGLVQARDNSLCLGPVELIRLGPPTVTPTSVEWPIQGGLLARAPGGRFRFETRAGRLMASVEDYQPTLPRGVYALTQLPIHHLWTRLHLLGVRGRAPATGAPADSSRRMAAAAIDATLCVSLAALAGRRRRLPVLLGVTAAYHVACWSTSGRTLGGALMNQRVVAVDGSALTATQALVRLLALPLGVLRPHIQDEIAGTDVVAL